MAEAPVVGVSAARTIEGSRDLERNRFIRDDKRIEEGRLVGGCWWRDATTWSTWFFACSRCCTRSFFGGLETRREAATGPRTPRSRWQYLLKVCWDLGTTTSLRCETGVVVGCWGRTGDAWEGAADRGLWEGVRWFRCRWCRCKNRDPSSGTELFVALDIVAQAILNCAWRIGGVRDFSVDAVVYRGLWGVRPCLGGGRVSLDALSCIDGRFVWDVLAGTLLWCVWCIGGELLCRGTTSREYLFEVSVSQMIQNSISISKDELPPVLKHTASGIYANLHIFKEVS